MERLSTEAPSRQTIHVVPTRLLLWLTCGTIGSLLFTTTYLIEGVTRPGYDAWQQAISALSLGPGGWLQQANFVIFGLITIWTAFAWRQFLTGGIGAAAYPIIRGVQGLALIVDGFFSQDPAGYPAGAAALTTPGVHAVIHQIFAFVAITAIAVGFCVLAPRLAKEPGWRWWATYSVVSALLTIVFIATFGALNGQHSAIAGIFERLATSVATVWDIIFLTRLWLGTGFGAFQRSVAAHAKA